MEHGDPESHFIYIGEQALSAYFEYLVFQRTGDNLWRSRAFQQMEFMLKGQNNQTDSPAFGVIHTAYDLRKKAFNSDDRGNNVGYKPDLNAHMARYMLLTWQAVKQHEGIDRADWHAAALRAADWVVRQQNPDGGLPQKVDEKTGGRSVSVVSGRALPAFPDIFSITGFKRYDNLSADLEKWLKSNAEAQLIFTGHHPDLPPGELEEASIWGAVEYWLGKYNRTHDPQYLTRATADGYLALSWWCPKQLPWVKNPTQLASAEQTHFLQYSIYSYQDRKLSGLFQLGQLVGEPFASLYDRFVQGVFFTQVTQGNLKGSTHERIADPWLQRSDYGIPADINSLGDEYMGEQSLDAFLQLVLLGHAHPQKTALISV